MNYYEELGLAPTASQEEIHRAYRKLAQVLHPDYQQDEALRRVCERQLARLNEVAAVLGDPERRREYDLRLKNARAAVPRPSGIERLRNRIFRLNAASLVWALAAAVGVIAIAWFIRSNAGEAIDPANRAAVRHEQAKEGNRDVSAGTVSQNVESHVDVSDRTIARKGPEGITSRTRLTSQPIPQEISRPADLNSAESTPGIPESEPPKPAVIISQARPAAAQPAPPKEQRDLAGPTLAANQSIGVAVANGAFQVDQSNVYGNATLFDGTLIETGTASSDLTLNNGTRVRLGTGSQARIHPDRIVLERGEAEIVSGSGCSIEALGFRATPESAGSRVVVTYSGSGHIQVAALAGSARISGSDGALVAQVPAGTALDVEPHAASAAAPSKLVGTVKSKGGAFLLSSDVSHLSYTLVGSALDKYIGKRVEITGVVDASAQPAGGSSKVLRVFSIRELPRTDNHPVRDKIIVAGAAIAALSGGAYALSTTSSPKSTISAP